MCSQKRDLEKVDKAMNWEKKGITRIPRRKLVEILNWTIYLDSNTIKEVLLIES